MSKDTKKKNLMKKFLKKAMAEKSVQAKESSEMAPMSGMGGPGKKYKNLAKK